jgi:hypothetical protein
MKTFMAVFFCLSLTLASCVFTVETAAAAEAYRIKLPEADQQGGKPLMQALALRSSNRSIDSQELNLNDISNLLWATWGVNRSDGRHTAPTANNKQQIAVYIALRDGVWRYDPALHELTRELPDNVLPKFGAPGAVLLYAAPADEPLYSGMHIGSLYQNAGLFCASAGLANVVKASVANALDGILPLPDGYKIFIAQLVGHPK